MSYSMMCATTGAINTAANVGLSLVSRFRSDISLPGGALFGVIAGVTYSIILAGTYTALDLIVDPTHLRERDKPIRMLAIVVTSVVTSIIVTTLFAPNFSSWMGMQVSYKTGAVYACFNVATTLLSGVFYLNN